MANIDSTNPIASGTVIADGAAMLGLGLKTSGGRKPDRITPQFKNELQRPKMQTHYKDYPAESVKPSSNKRDGGNP